VKTSKFAQRVQNQWFYNMMEHCQLYFHGEKKTAVEDKFFDRRFLFPDAWILYWKTQQGSPQGCDKMV